MLGVLAVCLLPFAKVRQPKIPIPRKPPGMSLLEEIIWKLKIMKLQLIFLFDYHAKDLEEKAKRGEAFSAKELLGFILILMALVVVVVILVV